MHRGTLAAFLPVWRNLSCVVVLLFVVIVFVVVVVIALFANHLPIKGDAMQTATLTPMESRWLPANLVVGCKYRISRDLDDSTLRGKHATFKRYARWMGQYLMAVVDVHLVTGDYGPIVSEEWLIKPHYLYPL